jgi:hypothetical protein
MLNLSRHAKIGQECCLIEIKDYLAVVVLNVDALERLVA